MIQLNKTDPSGLFEYIFHSSFTSSDQAHFWKVIQVLQDKSPHYRQMDAAHKNMIVRVAATDAKHTTGVHVGADHQPYLHLDPNSSTYLDKASYNATASHPGELPPRTLQGQAITVGHELGHFDGEKDEDKDPSKGGRNVEKNENRIRNDLLGSGHDRETYLGAVVRVYHDGPLVPNKHD